MTASLRSFLKDTLAADPGSVKLIAAESDRKFGFQSVAAKLAARGEHPALFFSNVAGANFPCITNLLGTYDRIALALACKIEDIPSTYGEKLSTLTPPVTVARERAPVKDVVLTADELDLGAIPVPWHKRTRWRSVHHGRDRYHGRL